MNRPLGLTIIAWLAIIGGGLQILASLGLVGVSGFGMLLSATGALEAVVLGLSLSIWTGIALMALAVLGIVTGIGILGMRPWSWTMGVVLFVLNLAAGIALLFVTGFGLTALYVTVFSAIVVGYLYTATARDALGHPSGGGATPHAPHPA